MKIHKCPKCDYKYSTLHYVFSDKIKKRIVDIKQTCPNCGEATMVNEIHEHLNGLSINNDSIRFFDNNFITLEEGKIVVNIKMLMTLGYAGILDVRLYNKSLKYGIDPLRNKIDKLR